VGPETDAIRRSVRLDLRLAEVFSKRCTATSRGRLVLEENYVRRCNMLSMKTMHVLPNRKAQRCRRARCVADFHASRHAHTDL
jgi:hypothetical protein